jgi:hypothetical protein
MTIDRSGGPLKAAPASALPPENSIYRRGAARDRTAVLAGALPRVVARHTMPLLSREPIGAERSLDGGVWMDLHAKIIFTVIHQCRALRQYQR